MTRPNSLSFFRLLSMSLLLSAIALPLHADKSDDAAITLAVARAKAELAVKHAQSAVDERRSGWDSLWQITEIIRNKTYNVLETRQQAEERNADDARDQALMDQIQTRLTKLHEDWDTYNAKDRAALNLSFQDASETVGRLSQALDSLVNAERAWKDADLEPATLQSAYEAIAKRAGEMRDQAEKALAAAKTHQKTIQSDLDDVNKFVGHAK